MAPNIAQLLSQARYRYQDQAKRDLSSAVSFYRNLMPKLDMYVYPDGTTKELLTLEGTIPVNYRGANYNIPVSLYLPDNYPYSPPMCYIKPTPDMQIKQSKHVDGSGKVHLPYLSDWRNGSSDMLGVIQVMVVVFGETPPVYQRPKNQPFSTDPSTFANQGFPGMPRPQATPYPPQPQNSPYLRQQTTPYPAYPQYPGYPPATGTSGFPTSSQAGYTPYPSYPSGATPYPQATPPPTNPQINSTNQNTGTITAQHLKDSLVTAVEDRVKAKEREKVEQHRAEVNVLRKQAEDLERGKRQLDEIMSKMEAEAVALSETKEQLRERDAQLDVLIAKHTDNEKQLDIDDAFGPMEPLYKQLLNAFAEENAIQDPIYYLSEAIQKGFIELEPYLKNVRELSRKQFMLKALMQKCREKAGLPC